MRLFIYLFLRDYIEVIDLLPHFVLSFQPPMRCASRMSSSSRERSERGSWQLRSVAATDMTTTDLLLHIDRMIDIGPENLAALMFLVLAKLDLLSWQCPAVLRFRTAESVRCNGWKICVVTLVVIAACSIALLTSIYLMWLPLLPAFHWRFLLHSLWMMDAYPAFRTIEDFSLADAFRINESCGQWADDLSFNCSSGQGAGKEFVLSCVLFWMSPIISILFMSPTCYAYYLFTRNCNVKYQRHPSTFLSLIESPYIAVADSVTDIHKSRKNQQGTMTVNARRSI